MRIHHPLFMTDAEYSESLARIQSQFGKESTLEIVESMHGASTRSFFVRMWNGDDLSRGHADNIPDAVGLAIDRLHASRTPMPTISLVDTGMIPPIFLIDGKESDERQFYKFCESRNLDIGHALSLARSNTVAGSTTFTIGFQDVRNF